METNYYEAYNRDNVALVDISEQPIDRIVPEGIKTSADTYEFDLIIYATGLMPLRGRLTALNSSVKTVGD